MIFIDRSIPESVAKALKCVRKDVVWLDDVLPGTTKDEDWLSHVGRNGWVAITRDEKIRYRVGEKDSWMRSGAGVFILNQSKNPTKWEYLKLISKTLDEMEDRFRTTPRPFGFAIDKQGAFRKIF